MKKTQQAHSRHQGKKGYGGEFISRELVLIKVHCAASQPEIVKTNFSQIMQAKIVDTFVSYRSVLRMWQAVLPICSVDLLKPRYPLDCKKIGTVAIDSRAQSGFRLILQLAYILIYMPRLRFREKP